ncbi:MAG: nadD [Phycisphaerales bacterium]|nr:nadD [Phycisphaerales bacterium]
MANYLYFGGSFNPPHLAHIACPAAAAVAAGLDGVVLIPTGQSALKDPLDLAPAADRLAMTELAAVSAGAAVPFHVDDREVERAGTTYTIDTVNELAEEGVAPINWLIGADQLLNFHRWRDFESLLSLAKFWVMARPGHAIDWELVHPTVRALRDHVVVVPQIEVSATDIRRRLRAGEPIDGLVVPAVAHYLAKRRLYLPVVAV